MNWLRNALSRTLWRVSWEFSNIRQNRFTDIENVTYFENHLKKIV